jgi:DNA-directed RNA polymerase specialized sigma24 family protein
MDQLYLSYFTSLTNFFWHLTARSDLIEELINDTMLELWFEGVSIGANTSVSVAIMGLAYSCGLKRLASASPQYWLGPRQRDDPNGSNLQPSLVELGTSERAALHLAHAVGHSRQDIADIMNISCESVDALLGAARRRYSWRHPAMDSRN